MADAGLYNFIKKELAKGGSREQITVQLQTGGNTQEAIEAAWAAVENNTPPEKAFSQMSHPVPVKVIHVRPISITVVCYLLGAGAILKLVQLVLFGGILTLLLGAAGGHFVRADVLAFSIIGVLGLWAVIVILLQFLIVYAYWMMRSWGVYVLGGLVMLAFLSHVGNPTQLLNIGLTLDVIALVVGIVHLGEMTNIKR